MIYIGSVKATGRSLRKEDCSLPQPVSGQVTVAANNLTGQLKSVALREIREQEAIYYIGEYGIANGETLNLLDRRHPDRRNIPPVGPLHEAVLRRLRSIHTTESRRQSTMRHSLEILLTLLALTFVGTQVANAQDEVSVFAIAYIEIKPSSASQAENLLKTYADESRAESGNLRFQILQRIGRPNHFAILDAWDNLQSQDDHSAATHTRTFRDSLKTLLYSPYDERRSTPTMGTSATGDEGEIYVLTHVDLAGRGREDGMALIETLVTTSREDAGAVDIGVIIQDSRTNHMTVFEVWSSAADQEAHMSAEHTVQVRNELLSRIGSPYDERIYRRL
jgi:quinol monooxygenase YgiN